MRGHEGLGSRTLLGSLGDEAAKQVEGTAYEARRGARDLLETLVRPAERMGGDDRVFHLKERAVLPDRLDLRHVKARAREVYDQWCGELGGMDHEIVDATAATSNEAQTAIARLLEALNTLPFFGGAKVVWLKDCNFLGDDRTATSKGVTEALGDLAKVLKCKKRYM